MEVKLEDISHDFAVHFITSVAALAKFLLRGKSVFPCLGGSRTPWKGRKSNIKLDEVIPLKNRVLKDELQTDPLSRWKDF